MKNMDKQSDLVNPKSVEDCGNHAHTDEEFEEHSEGEMLSEDEPNEEGSSDEESAEEIPCGEESDDADSCAEGSNEEDSEELEEVLEEESDEDEEISEVSEEKSNRKEALRCSMDQISPVNDSDDAPSLREEKKASDAVVDVPQVSGKRRRSGWDVKDEDVILVNDSGGLGKKSETRLCATNVVNCSGEESCQEDSDEELEEAFEEYNEDDDSVKETNEEEINKEPTTSCSMDQLLVNEPSKLFEEKASGNLSAVAVVDVPRVSSKRRPSRWDIKAEGLVPVNDGGNLGKREIGWSSDIKVKSSVLMNDSADLNKERKTRWSSDKSPLDVPRPLQHRSSRKVEKRLEWLNMKLQAVNSNLEHYLTTKADNLEKQTLSSQAIDDVHFEKLLQDRDHFVCQIHRMHEAKRKTKLHQTTYKFKKLIALPMKEDSRYNLAALMIGPNGKTLNDMEEKTGTKLSLRGKDGSYRRNISKWEDIHLMIKANSCESIDAAVSMIQDLWQHKKHIKAAQLRELAKIKGTLREESIDFVWTRCDICGDQYHPASDCPLVATDAETVKKFHTGPGSLFSSYGDKDKCEAQIMPAELVVNCIPPVSNDKKLVVGVAAPSPPSPNANLPSYPGFSVVPPSSWNANLPNYSGFAVPPSTSNANVPSYRESATISPSSNANLPSFPGHSTAPSLPSSMNLNLPSSSKNAPLPSFSSISKPPNYTKYVAIPPSSPMSHRPVVLPSSSSNTNLSTHHVPPAIFPASSKVNLESYPAITAVPPSSNTNLLSFPGFVPPFSSNANSPSFPGIAFIRPPSSNINRSSYPKLAANLPASSNANVPSYPRFTAATPSNSNLSSYTGLAANPPPSSNAKPQSFPKSTGALPSSSNAKSPSYPKSSAIPPPSSNGNSSSYARLAPIPPSSSNANLPNRTGLAAIPQVISKSNNWPGPPGSSLPESSYSFLKSGYNSPVQTGSALLQTSIPFGTNAHILDRNKPVLTGAPPSSTPKYPEFAATSRGIAVPNSWPHPTVPMLPESGASFPMSSCNSLKFGETMRLQSSTPPGSTGQPSTSSSQFPGITVMSKEFTSFPGYNTGFAANCPPTSKVNLPSYPGLTTVPKTTSNLNLSSDAGLAAIPQKAHLSNNWSAPPLPLASKSGSSFFKSSYNSPEQSGSAPFQSPASLGKNADILDGKKLELTVTATPPPPSNPNSLNYSNFAATPPEVPARNFWPQPSVSILPKSGTSVPESIYSSLKYGESRPLPSSSPLGFTGQTTVSASHLPYAVSNELASFPGYPKRIDASYPCDRPVPSRSLSSQPAHFTSNFSGKQMNPAWRNYNHPTSN